MKSYLLFATFLLLLSINYSCKKKATDPCLGVLSENQPWMIAVKFIDKDTKQNLITDKTIDTTKLKIINQKDQSIIQKYIHEERGLVMLYVPEKSEDYKLQIQTGASNPVELEFSSKVSPIPCGINHEVKEVSIKNHPFEILEKNNRRYVLEVKI